MGGENLRITRQGYDQCRECHRTWQAEYRAKHPGRYWEHKKDELMADAFETEIVRLETWCEAKKEAIRQRHQNELENELLEADMFMNSLWMVLAAHYDTEKTFGPLGLEWPDSRPVRNAIEPETVLAPIIETVLPVIHSEPTEEESLRKSASILGRLGGRKGGKARAANMTPETRTRVSREAANARWYPKEEEMEEMLEDLVNKCFNG